MFIKCLLSARHCFKCYKYVLTHLILTILLDTVFSPILHISPILLYDVEHRGIKELAQGIVSGK